ncbi:MAG: TonB-dependent receptor plug domain-containing protein [Spirosomataceae bacterium]
MMDFCLAHRLRQGLWLLCWLQGSIFFDTFAQQATELPTVSVMGTALEKYAAGAKVQRFDSTELNAFRFNSLGQLLAVTSSLAFKEYGAGRLSTVSFRGTSASHTAVLWNGININSATLGLSDFSVIPVQAFNQLSIVFGGGSSNFGTDAVGGSIHLNSTPTWQPKTAFQLGGQFASFGNTNIQLLAQISTPKLEQKATFFYDAQPNCYPYDSLLRYAVGVAQFKRIGGMYDAFWKGKRNALFGVHVWSQRAVTHLEPSTSNTFQFDQTIRVLAEMQVRSWESKIGFIQDNFLYQSDQTLVSRWLGRVEKEWTSFNLPFQGKGSLKAGTEVNLYHAYVDAYGQLIDEWRADAYVLFRQHWGSRLYSTLNCRQSFSSAYTAPIAPSVGLKWKVLQLQKSQLTFNSTWAISYHIPTLNERYWQPQGNPLILPENGLNYEAGFIYNWQPTPQIHIETGATGFRNNVKNWIIWNPTKNYKAENIQHVISQGIELKLKMLYKSTEHSFDINTHYSLTRSTFNQVNSPFDYDFIGKQLIYIPVHTVASTVLYQTHGFSVLAQGYYYSKRYTTSDNTKYLPAFAQFRVQVSKKIQFLTHHLTLSSSVNNLLNTLYLSIENKAMPGRNFALQLIYSFDKPTKQLLP